MNEYVASMTSSQRHTLHVVNSILQCSMVDAILFPAVLPVGPGENLVISSPGEFDIAVVPREFLNESVANIPLHSENNRIQLDITLYLEETNLPDACVFEFDSQYISASKLQIEDVRKLLNEMIPVFDIDHAIIYNKVIARQRSIKYFVGPDRRYPLMLGWVTYFGPKLVDFLGHARFENLNTYFGKYQVQDGILIALQEHPWSENDLSAKEKQERAEFEIEFNEFDAP